MRMFWMMKVERLSYQLHKKLQDASPSGCPQASRAARGDIIRPMNLKPVVALLAVSMLVVSETITLDHREHIHSEMRTEPVATPANYVATLGRMMRSVMRKTDNGVIGEIFLYELDLPFAQTIQIVHHVNRGPGWQLCWCWQIRCISGGVCGEWRGKFASAMEAALAAQARPAILFQ